MRTIRFATIAALFTASNLVQAQPVGLKTQALDSSVWEMSEWISVENAPVAKGRADKIRRAADGASWFVSDVRNEKEVTTAKWMTVGLGVYELYLNGQPVGEEVLKPGFTHYAKTKRSFTYDMTEAFLKKKGRVASATPFLNMFATPCVSFEATLTTRIPRSVPI